MTRGDIRKEVVVQRSIWIREMIAGIRDVTSQSIEDFMRGPHSVAAAESYLRRALEALLDLGRHLLAKGFGVPAAEYKAIAISLEKNGVLKGAEADLMHRMAGYRNRIVHFYNEISDEEIYEICHFHSDEIEQVLAALLNWFNSRKQ